MINATAKKSTTGTASYRNKLVDCSLDAIYVLVSIDKMRMVLEISTFGLYSYHSMLRSISTGGGGGGAHGQAFVQSGHISPELCITFLRAISGEILFQSGSHSPCQATGTPYLQITADPRLRVPITSCGLVCDSRPWAKFGPGAGPFMLLPEDEVYHTAADCWRHPAVGAA